MSEKRFWFVIDKGKLEYVQDNVTGEKITVTDLEDLLNEQQEFIEELQVSDEMGWKRAEHFEKKCPKELHNKKMYIKRLEYKVQKFKEMNGEQQATIERLEEEKRYWKSKAMTLLMQVRRLTPRMSAKEVIAFSKELEDE